MKPNNRKPSWLKVKIPSGKVYREVYELVKHKNLHTVCGSARCPNIGECWENRTAAFMILGDVCTRNCAFCAVVGGLPLPVDQDEPQRLAESVKKLDLKYVVITSVTRDDLPDGGASQFVRTIQSLREISPQCKIEVLIPDFSGSQIALSQVIDAAPDILNHNLETVPSLYPAVRPQADYKRSLRVLELTSISGLMAKTGLMLGLGESGNEVQKVMGDILNVGCRLLTLGQYLQPSKRHHPVLQFIHPDEFERWAQIGREMGFNHVEAGPLVRSSYRAHQQVESLL